jgi:hypothetical protein
MRNLKYHLPAMTIAILFLATVAMAKEISIHYPAKLGNGPELQPGTYKIELVKNQTSPEVLFYKGRELVARTPAKVEEQPRKADQTQVFYDIKDKDRVITELRISGWKERVVFTDAGSTASSGSNR